MSPSRVARTVRGPGRIGPSWLLAAAALLTLATPASAAPGQLDPSFDGDGRVVTPFDPARNDVARAVVVPAAGGKIVAAGYVARTNHHDFALARYLSDGSLDPTFDTDGKVTTNVSGRCSQAVPCSDDVASDAAQDSSGRIVVVGLSSGAVGVARYQLNGSRDATFDGDGLVRTDLGAPVVWAAVAIQTDGRIVVAASAGEDIVMLRYNTNGGLDPTFDNNGIKFLDFGEREAAADVAIQQDGRIVVLGSQQAEGHPDLLFVRLLSGGPLDSTFSSDGLKIMSVDDNDQPASLAIQKNGRIVGAGTSNDTTPGAPADPPYIMIVRLSSKGALDTSFGSGGIVRHDATAASDRGLALALQDSGATQKIVVAGVTGNVPVPLVTRYLPSGAPDPTWRESGPGAIDGVVRTSFPGYGISSAKAVGIQADGKVVVAGSAIGQTGADFVLARFLNA